MVKMALSAPWNAAYLCAVCAIVHWQCLPLRSVDASAKDRWAEERLLALQRYGVEALVTTGDVCARLRQVIATTTAWLRGCSTGNVSFPDACLSSCTACLCLRQRARTRINQEIQARLSIRKFQLLGNSPLLAHPCRQSSSTLTNDLPKRFHHYLRP